MNEDHKRAILAVGISAIILIAWQYFFVPKVAPPPQLTPEEIKVAGQPQGSANSKYQEINDDLSAKDKTFEKKDEVTLKTSIASYILQSPLGIDNIENVEAKFPFDSILGSDRPVEIQALVDGRFRSIDIAFSKVQEGLSIKGEDKKLGIEFDAKILENGKLNYKLLSKEKRDFRIVIHSAKTELENRQIREFIFLSKDVKRFKVTDDDKGEAVIHWMGVDFNYHLFAMTFSDPLSISYRADYQGNFAVITNKELREITGNIVFVKKEYDYLESLGEKLKLSVDFGIFGILAIPILRGLQFFYSLIPNYGVSIILLTILIRIITFPLQYKSFKSMKKMQVVQPELTKLREKFKDDPQRMQKETMALFKRAGANPLSGCFPLLLQMPIFFAFYRVLFCSVELVGAPFFGWIKDLSIKDPYYILPILMTLAFYLHQKITPATTADPTQRKIMMFMPLVFGAIMKDLPSGLTLYILVSTVCGMLMQMVIYKQK